MSLRHKIYSLLRLSEKYTKTDMVYLAKGGTWLIIGQLASSASAFLLAIAFANLLPKETYGIYKYVLSISSMLTIFSLSGINTSITRTVAKGFEGSFIPSLKTKIKWGLIGSLVSLFLAGYYFWNDNTTLTFGFLITAVFLPLMDSFNLYISLLIGQKKFKTLSSYNIVTKIIITIAMVVTLFVTKNIFLILFTYFISYTAVRFIFLKITIRKTKLNTNKDSSTISYGKHLTIMDAISTVAAQIDKILTFHFLGAAQLAIYSFALAMPEQIKSILKNLKSLALPKFSQGSPQEIKKTIFKKMAKFSLLISLIVIIYILLAQYIFKIFFPQYTDSILYSQIFSISLITASSILLSSFLKAQKAKKQLYKLNILSPIITIALLVYFVYFYGIMGIIIAKVLSRFVNLMILIWLTKTFNPEPSAN